MLVTFHVIETLSMSNKRKLVDAIIQFPALIRYNRREHYRDYDYVSMWCVFNDKKRTHMPCVLLRVPLADHEFGFLYVIIHAFDFLEPTSTVHSTEPSLDTQLGNIYTHVLSSSLRNSRKIPAKTYPTLAIFTFVMVGGQRSGGGHVRSWVTLEPTGNAIRACAPWRENSTWRPETKCCSSSGNFYARDKNSPAITIGR